MSEILYSILSSSALTRFNELRLYLAIHIQDDSQIKYKKFYRYYLCNKKIMLRNTFSQ